MLCASVAKDSDQVGPIRGTGPGRFRRRARRIELAETLIPGFRSPPWMPHIPTVGFPTRSNGAVNLLVAHRHPTKALLCSPPPTLVLGSFPVGSQQDVGG